MAAYPASVSRDISKQGNAGVVTSMSVPLVVTELERDDRPVGLAMPHGKERRHPALRVSRSTFAKTGSGRIPCRPRLVPIGAPPERARCLIAGTPLRRPGEVQGAANAVWFLWAAEALFINGLLSRLGRSWVSH